jgi:hypothetical protein
MNGHREVRLVMCSSPTPVPHTDLVEWRARSVQLARLLHSDSHPTWVPPANLISTLTEKLRDLIPADQDPEVVRIMLLDISEKAYRIALIFRSSRTEYLWLQKGETQLDETQVEVLEAAPIHETYRAPTSRLDRTVFGAVVKGGGVSGTIEEEATVLRKSQVLLWPFGG